MDIREEYIIRESINDVIRILDSAEVRPDFSSDTVIVQVTNRAPIAHLAIERGLKALIVKGGGKLKRIHSLGELLETLDNHDNEAADFLRMAFADAVAFFNYNVNAKGFEHFQSLDSYLSEVGTKQAFQDLRYWAIGESTNGGDPIPSISLYIHREVLCALHCLFLRSYRDTVSARVERDVASKVAEIRKSSDTRVDRLTSESASSYANWLNRSRGEFRKALESAVRSDFKSEECDEFWSMNLRSAFKELGQSSDPAVRYFIGTCSYLPEGSQYKAPDANPKVVWNDQKNKGTVTTPAGNDLGFIQQYADGAWGIIPSEAGLVQTTAIAEALSDAKHYLVNRLTCHVRVTVNGRPKTVRIVGEPTSSADWTSETEDVLAENSSPETLVLEFWDIKHGLQVGDRVSLEIPSQGSPRYASFYDGSVTELAEQKVSMEGSKVLGLATEGPQS